jgi:predicted metal-dependent hydrolase
LIQPGLPFEAPATVVFARHPRARRYVIRVTDEQTVRVTIPRWGSRRGALAFVDSERPWIDRQRKRMEAQRQLEKVNGEWPDRRSQERDLRARAEHELPPRLLELAACFGLQVNKISVRNQRWRWGSCSPNGHICLNWRLVQMPQAVRDYVLIHELMHLRRMDHSPKFWKLVSDACPEYREHRRFLRSHPRA